MNTSEIREIKNNFNDKFHEQNVRFDNFDEKFDQIDEKFNEIKNEIKKRNENFDKQKNKVDENYESKMVVENSRESNKLNENKDDKVSSGENFDNRIKNMVLENNGVNIDSEILERVEYNVGMLVRVDERERKWRKNIQVEGLQGVNFSRNVVVGIEKKASRAYLEHKRSPNSCPWIFCAPDRWCSNYELVSPAYIERESMIWCYGERYLERELCVDSKVEILK